jgi:hypothetical protein
MKRMLWGLALAFVTSAFAQQQPPTNSPPYTNPPTFPEGRPQRQMPPDTKAPPPQDLSASEIEQQIQDKLNHEPALANTEIGVKIDAKSGRSLGRWIRKNSATSPSVSHTIVCRPPENRGQDEDSGQA